MECNVKPQGSVAFPHLVLLPPFLERLPENCTFLNTKILEEKTRPQGPQTQAARTDYTEARIVLHANVLSLPVATGLSAGPRQTFRGC